MLRLVGGFAALVLLLSACADAPTSSARPATTAQAYIIAPEDAGRIQFRMLDSVNSLRAASGLGPVQLDAALNAAAATHSRDMSLQNRPWHFGSDGSSPIDRVRRVGYTGALRGETISETYESEVETLAAWIENPNTRPIIYDPRANQMGFAWYQESNGKIWWTLVMGQSQAGVAPTQVAARAF